MLYDKRWDTKVDPFTFEAFVEWLERQPPDKAYHIDDPSTCAIGQWLESAGMARPLIHNESLRLGMKTSFWNAAIGEYGQTFGQALARAKGEAAPETG